MQFPATDSIIVKFSGGKDSIVVLDICMKRFKHVEAYFMYYVKGLSFCEEPLQWAEKRYGIKIERTPHWELPKLLRAGAYSFTEYDLKLRKPVDVDDLMRAKFGIDWLASGESKFESFERRGMLSGLGKSSVRDGVSDEKRRIWFPLADWTKSAVFNYMKRNRLLMPSFYRYNGRGFGYFNGREMSFIKKYFPDDYQKILKVFPHLEAVRLQYEMKEKLNGEI